MSTVIEPARETVGTHTVVRVNLLPRELEERARQRRIAVMAGAGVAAWVVVLGSLYGMKLGEVAERELARDDEQVAVTLLQSELATLAPYRQLASSLEHKNTQLSTAMAEEISWARVMNDVSLAVPADASLQTFAVTTEDAEAAPAPGEIAVGESVASVQFTGYSVDEYAPGVESMLLDLSGVRSFFNVHLATANDAEIGDTEVTNFTGSSLMDEQAFTGRYKSGLPAEELQ